MNKNGERRLQQNRSDCASKDNHQCRPIDQGIDMTTLKPITTDNGSKGDNDSYDTEDIHTYTAAPNSGPISSNESTRSDSPAFSTAWGIP